MSRVLPELRYSLTHEWARIEHDGLLTVGITDHAQALLGDIVFIELPQLKIIVKANEEISVIESVKAASDIYAPVSGIIVAVNSALENNCEWINVDPYEKGWLFRIELTDTAELENLMNADDYTKRIMNEAH